MLRKMAITVASALAGLVLFGGVAAADINDYSADDQPIVGVANEDRAVEVGQTFVLSLGGFDPFEIVDVSWSYTFGEAPPGFIGPSGLRSSRALLSDPQNPFVVQTDKNGAGSQTVSFDQDGYVTFVGVGRNNGHSSSAIVKIGTGGTKPTGPAAPTTTVAAGGGSGSGDGDGLAFTGQGSGDGANGGLAYTGASIAGPLAIGLGALLAGVLLLFFGTRGFIRNRASRSAASL